MSPATSDRPADLERLAMDVAVAAGQLIVARRPADLEVATKSSRTDVVTVMDAAAEELLRGQLLTARPDDAFFGEEAGSQPGGSGLTWVVDPIDGTVNYLYGLPAYAVSVAAVTGDPARPNGWSTLVGAVYQPATGQLFHARRGAGAAVRYVGHTAGADTPLRVRPATPLPEALVATGFSYRARTRAAQAALLAGVLPRVRDIRRGGSAALDLCSVASGRLDGFYEQDLNPWDIAAGWLLVTEAGGRVSGWRGSAPAAPGLVAASSGVHGPLLALLEEVLGALAM